MRFLKRWVQMLQIGQLLQEVRRNAIGQQFGRCPEVIRQCGRHGWSNRLLASQRSCASRGLWLRQWLAETAMWQHQMVVYQRQPQLSLKTPEGLGEALGGPHSTTIALAL